MADFGYNQLSDYMKKFLLYIKKSAVEIMQCLEKFKMLLGGVEDKNTILIL